MQALLLYFPPAHFKGLAITTNSLQHGKTYLTKPFSLADFHRAIADFFDH
jgi:hypothetical protein